MRVTAAAVAGATIATLLAVVARAPYPAQFVTTTAAGCAFLALLLRPGRPSSSDWFKVRFLLAVNLVVFGIRYAHKLSLALAATTVSLGLPLLAMTIRARMVERGRHRSEASRQLDRNGRPGTQTSLGASWAVPAVREPGAPNTSTHPTRNRPTRPPSPSCRPAQKTNQHAAARPAGYGSLTTAKRQFTADQARAAGERIGIDWSISRFDVEQFRMGMEVELEHGTHDPETNVTDDNVDVTAKIARAHLNEFPDYHSRLAVMEADAEAYWESQDN
jgi:Protein of unknown function (DUF5661)